MFCPPGSKLRASRSLSRKQMKMQQKAMEEAVAAGWRLYDGEESSDDEGGNDEKVLWVMPPKSIPHSSAQEKNAPITVDVSEKSFSSLQMLSPEYFDARKGGPSPNPTTGSSEADEEESVAESHAEDGTALEDKEQLHALLDELLLLSPPTPHSSGLFSPQKDSPIKGFSSFAPRFEQAEGSENTVEATETEATIDGKDVAGASSGKNGGFQSPANQVPVSLEDSCSISSDDEESDADSLDLGVSTSVWSSQEMNVIPSINNDSSAQISNIFSPFSQAGSLRNGGFYDQTDGEESIDDGTDEEHHEGTDVFLLTEGARYSGHKNGSASKNDLFHIQEAKYQTFEAVPSSTNGAFVEKLALGGVVNTSKQEGEASDDGDSLDFQPRFHENVMNAMEDLKIASRDDNSQDATDNKAHDSSNTNAGGDSCFGGIQLVSPKFFNSNAKSTKLVKVPPASIMSPLASMVHPMNLDLFDAKLNITPVLKHSSNRSVSSSSESGEKLSEASGPVKRCPASVLQSEQYTISESGTRNNRSSLSSSFRSSTKANRVAYNLSSGKKSMSKTQRVYSKSFLPNKPLLSPDDIPASTSRVTTNNGTLSILLVEMNQKMFEVIAVDVNRDTTVGDVLAKARSVATDPALSDQKYVSFCYGDQEFGAPMLPVNVVIDWEKHKTRPLVVAVPAGSTAAEMQSVKRVLWKNPKLRGWWKQQDPFQPKPKKDKSDSSVRDDYARSAGAY